MSRARPPIPGQQAFEWEPATPPKAHGTCEWPVTTGWGRVRRCDRLGGTDPALGLILCWQHERLVEDNLARYLSLRPQLVQALYWEAFVERQLGELPDPGAALVYFLARDGLVKIGTSMSLPGRARDIGKGSSMICGMTVGPVRILATMPGDRRHEDFLHRRFAHLRVDGEWFLPGDDLCQFMARRRDADPDLIEEVRIRHGMQDAS